MLLESAQGDIRSSVFSVLDLPHIGFTIQQIHFKIAESLVPSCLYVSCHYPLQNSSQTHLEQKGHQSYMVQSLNWKQGPLLSILLTPSSR